MCWCLLHIVAPSSTLAPPPPSLVRLERTLRCFLPGLLRSEYAECLEEKKVEGLSAILGQHSAAAIPTKQLKDLLAKLRTKTLIKDIVVEAHPASEALLR